MYIQNSSIDRQLRIQTIPNILNIAGECARFIIIRILHLF